MKSIILGLFLLVPAVSFAHEEDADACAAVFKACAAQGFTKDEAAAPGMKIWLNCADIILNGKKAVAKVDVDPKGWDANNCRDYRAARAKFDADWARTHKKPE